MPFDMTQKRISIVERKKLQLKISFEDADLQIAALRKLGSKWYARWELPNGAERTKPAKNESDARRIEILERNKIKMGETSDPRNLKTTFHAVLDYYLENKMKGRSSFLNARAHVNNCKAYLDSRLTLEKIDKDPHTIFTAYFKSLPKLNPKSFGDPKSVWNHKVSLCAAMNYFIRMKRLRILNPFLVLDMPMPVSRREEVIEKGDYEVLLNTAGHEKYPGWVWTLLVCGWECGLRMGEYLSWRWEWVTLEPTGDDLPWLKTLIQKQGSQTPVWREIPLSQDAANALRFLRGQKEAGPVFVPERTTVYKYLRMVFAEADLKRHTFHDFRRSYKRTHMHLDKALRMLMQGQKSEVMDDHYMIVKRKQMEAAVRGTYREAGHGAGQE